MEALLAASLILQLAGPPQDALQALHQARSAIGFVDDCRNDGPHPDFDAKADLLDERYHDAEDRLTSIWGTGATASIAFPEPVHRRCTRANILAAITEAERAFADHDLLFAAAIAPMSQGVWLGSLHLCKDSVAEATIGEDELTQQPELTFHLEPVARGPLTLLTANSVGRRLALRLDGRLVVSPGVNQSIREWIAINGSDAGELERIRTASLAPC
jgi:preprotein translocase subunit SecD